MCAEDEDRYSDARKFTNQCQLPGRIARHYRFVAIHQTLQHCITASMLAHTGSMTTSHSQRAAAFIRMSTAICEADLLL